MKKLIIILGILLIFPIGKNLKAQVIQQDFDALVALYNATNGANWYNHTNWSTTVNNVSNSWYGVTVEGDRVVELNLWGNNMVGTLTPQLGNLTQLRKLVIRQNYESLTGEIPVEFENLQNLTYLDLSSNYLIGNISGSLTNLVNLRYLNLHGILLNGILPTSIGNLINLIELDLSVNGLTEFPSTIGNLTNLQRMILYNNAFSTLPNELSSLSNLNFLDFSDNYFTSFPLVITQLTNLDSLYFMDNDIDYLPSEIGNMTGLISFALNNTLLSSLPTEFSNLIQIRELYLAECNFIEIPIQISGLINLTILYLDNDYHQMSGNNIDTIPEFITNFTSLKKLYLRNNEIRSIPDYLYNINSLEYLFLQNNQISGSISPLISNLTNLISLELQNNNMSGELPQELSNMNSLDWIDFSNNSFGGNFPFLPNLSNIKINNNKFIQLPDYSTNFITDLKIENNFFTFEDIEPNEALYNFTYSPQKDIIIDPDTIILPIGAELDLAIEVGGEFNQYQWFKNDDAVNTVSEVSSYTVITNTNSFGTYKCKVTNTLVTDLTISTIPIQVLRDYAPVISTIPAQSVFQGVTFETVILDNFVTDDYTNDTAIVWTTNALTNFSVNIDENRIATISALNPEWIGQETITFTAADSFGQTISSDATFTILAPNTAPVISDIPNQTVIQGNPFTTINLNNYVTDDYTPDISIEWTTNTTENYDLNISSGNFATIEPLNPDWFGSETITFTASDEYGLSSSNEAIFTVEELIDISETENQNVEINVINNQIHISNPDNEKLTVEIYQLDGKLVYSDKIYSSEYIVNNSFINGVYSVKVWNKTKNIVEKIYIQ